jgi:hypothetical protein
MTWVRFMNMAKSSIRVEYIIMRRLSRSIFLNSQRYSLHIRSTIPLYPLCGDNQESAVPHSHKIPIIKNQTASISQDVNPAAEVFGRRWSVTTPVSFSVQRSRVLRTRNMNAHYGAATLLDSLRPSARSHRLRSGQAGHARSKNNMLIIVRTTLRTTILTIITPCRFVHYYWRLLRIE